MVRSVGMIDVGEHRFGLVGVVVADPRALFDLGPAGDDRFAHLDRHQAGEFVLPLFEAFGRGPKDSSPLGKRNRSPVEEGPVGGN